MHEREAIEHADVAEKQRAHEEADGSVQGSIDPYAPTNECEELVTTDRQLGRLKKAMEREELIMAEGDRIWKHEKMHFFNARLKEGHYLFIRVPLDVHTALRV
jgi:hypothetical protein